MSPNLIAAFLTGLAAALPGLREPPKAVVTFVVAAIVSYLIYIAVVPSFAWPFFGLPSFVVLAFLALGTYVAESKAVNASALALGVVLVCGSIASGWNLLNADKYAAKAGTIEERVWSRDIQPKDPTRIRLVTPGIAKYNAMKALSQDGAIGSQFDLDADHATLQKVKDKLVYAIPLDFNSFSVWQTKSGVPAYVLTDAIDPYAKPQLVAMSKPMAYSPGAWFSNNLERHLQAVRPFLNPTSIRFELDDDMNPHWVVALTAPTAGWEVESVEEIAVVDPTTGEVASYAPDKAPAWIDVVYPASVVNTYLEKAGALSRGWINANWGSAGVTKPEATTLVYGSDGHMRFVTGMTSTSENNESLVDLDYTDPRTGKTVRYATPGGATDSAINAAVEANATISYRHLSASDPQIYNVLGVQTAVVPMSNKAGGYAGVALAAVADIQEVAFGESVLEALDGYKGIVMRHGATVALQADPTGTTVEGIVDRIAPPGVYSAVFLFHLEGNDHLFAAPAQDNATVGLTRPGDKVSITAVGTSATTLAVKRFVNRSLILAEPGSDKAVREHGERAAADGEARANGAARDAIMDRLRALPTEALQKMMDPASK